MARFSTRGCSAHGRQHTGVASRTHREWFKGGVGGERHRERDAGGRDGTEDRASERDHWLRSGQSRAAATRSGPRRRRRLNAELALPPRDPEGQLSHDVTSLSTCPAQTSADRLDPVGASRGLNSCPPPSGTPVTVFLALLLCGAILPAEALKSRSARKPFGRLRVDVGERLGKNVLRRAETSRPLLDGVAAAATPAAPVLLGRWAPPPDASPGSISPTLSHKWSRHAGFWCAETKVRSGSPTHTTPRNGETAAVRRACAVSVWATVRRRWHSEPSAGTVKPARDPRCPPRSDCASRAAA